MYKKYYLKTKTACDVARDACFGTRSVRVLKYMEAPKEDYGRFHFWLCSLSDFHKAQCFYSIALQIASFVSIYGNNKNRIDDIYLLLVSTDGILPMTMTLYTLLVLGHAEIYDSALAAVSVLLASISMVSIFHGYSSVTAITSAGAPSSCGNLPLTSICNISVVFEAALKPNIFFAKSSIVVDVLVLLMILGCCLSQCNILDESRILAYFQNMRRSTRTIAISTLHLVTTLILVSRTASQMYFFAKILRPSNSAVSREWSFGQIVGITIWFAFIVDLIRYEINKVNHDHAFPCQGSPISPGPY